MDTSLPRSYRAEVLEHVMPALLAGECCSLIGPSSVGKSNLCQFVQRADVHKQYWGTTPIWLVLIDTNSLVLEPGFEDYAVLELLVHRLLREAERRNIPPDVLSEFQTRYLELADRRSAHLGFRYLERICGRLCEGLHLKIVFWFDQFEDIWATLPARLFVNLRALRDMFKYHVMYAVVCRERLQRSRPDPHSTESFWELFGSHTYGLGMYSIADATTMLDRIQQRSTLALDEHQRQSMLELSGCHPGLLRALIWANSAERLDTARLSALDSVREECAKIWRDLPADQQAVLQSIALGATPAPSATLHDLMLIGLVGSDSRTLFSPVFADYVRAQSGAQAGVAIATDRREVWVNGVPLDKPLARLEFDMLAYLAQHNGQVCRREDILHALYEERVVQANDERLDTLLRRLREALNDDARKPRYLITHRGVGIQLLGARILA